MAFNDFLVDRIRQRLQGKGQLVEKKMMGGLVFMLNNKMAIGVDVDKVSSEDRLMVRVGKANYEQLLTKKGSRKMDFTGRPMNGYLFIGPEGFDLDEDLDFWVEKALQFNRELISKSAKK